MMMFKSLLLTLCLTHMIGCVTSQDACDMRAVLSRLNALENEVRVLKEENAVLKQEVEDLKQESTDQENTLFMVSLTEHSNSIGDDAAIIWDRVIIDKGNNFDTIYGKYTVPYTGYYHITVNKRSNDYWSKFYLLVNEERHYLNSVDGKPDNKYPSSCVTVTLKFKKDDTIRVQNDISTAVYGSYTGFIQSWFTGFMLYRTED